MRGLEHLLQAREAPRQEAAVEALAALTMGNADVLDTIVASGQPRSPCIFWMPCMLVTDRDQSYAAASKVLEQRMHTPGNLPSLD